MAKSFKVVIKTRLGYDRFESFMAPSKDEVRMVVEATLKQGEKIKCIIEE